VGTGGRGTRRRVFFIALPATTGLLGLTVLVSSASTSTPVLTVTKVDIGYKVAWTYASTDVAQDRELEIDRGPDPAHFTEWARVQSPEHSSWRYDRHPLTGPNYYRARLFVRGTPGEWSAIVGVNVPPTTTTRTTTSTATTSTTTTTVRPTTTTTTVKPTTTTTTTVKPTTTTTKPTTTTTKPKPPPTTVKAPPPPNPCTTSRADVLYEINLVRKWVHRPLLRESTNLDGAAQAHVWYMYYVGSVSHGPGGNPPLWVKEITDKGYNPYAKLGQSLGGGMNNAHDLVRAWVGSPGHLATMIDADFVDLGVGCFKNTTGRGWPWYWAADFGRR